DTTRGFDDFSPYVASLNSEGTVAFQASLKGGGSGIFTGTGGRITTIADTLGSPFSRFYSHPAINSNGELSFYAELKEGGQGVYRTRGDGQFTTIADTISGPLSHVGPYGPTMNEAGVVAFRADLVSGDKGLFTGDGQKVTVIADTHGDFRGFQGLPVVNNEGTVAFKAYLAGGRQGIYTGNGEGLTAIADTSGPFAGFCNFPGLNDEGMVACSVLMKSGWQNVFTIKEQHLVTIIAAAVGGSYVDFLNSVYPSTTIINNAGTVVFEGRLRDGTLGLFAGPDPVADRVIAVGDPFLGPTVASFILSPVPLNSRDQLAIRVELANGIQVIVRADPVGDSAARGSIHVVAGMDPASARMAAAQPDGTGSWDDPLLSPGLPPNLVFALPVPESWSGGIAPPLSPGPQAIDRLFGGPPIENRSVEGLGDPLVDILARNLRSEP